MGVVTAMNDSNYFEDHPHPPWLGRYKILHPSIYSLREHSGTKYNLGSA